MEINDFVGGTKGRGMDIDPINEKRRWSMNDNLVNFDCVSD